MSVFSSSDDRIVIEEIVEATTEDQVELCSTIETIDESSVATSVAVTEIAEAEDQQQQQQQQQHTHSHHHTSAKNGGGNGHLSRQSLAVNHGSGNNNNNNNNNNSSSTNNNNNNNNNSNSNVGRVTPRSHMEQEKRMRREIANSNERRRMQSINAGFQSLRTLLPHHEGEKLSKAAILQQTAEYIYQLEQEKTHLLSQNSQLKRLVNQHEGGEVPIKKRKAETQGVVVSLPMHVNESGDEGLGSMSPEPLSVITVTTEAPPSSASSHSVVNSEVIVELRRQLERERHARLLLEKQMRAYQSQLYPERFRDNQLMTYQPHEVIEHTDNVMAQETEEAVAALQVVSVVSLPPVGSTQTVETSSPDPSSPPLSPEVCDVVPEDVKDEESRPESPKILAFATNATFAAIDEQSNTDSFTQSVTYVTTEFKASPQFITASPPRPFSPETEPQRLPSVLEAAMKAEPKVEVERLPSPSNTLDDGTPQARLYLANTSRQNLETIVEAIRHLEGDHLFSDEPAQDVPLALTNKPTTTATIIPSIAAVAAAAAASATTATTTTTTTAAAAAAVVPTSNAAKQQQRQLLHAEVNNFLQFHSQQQQQQQQQTQQRPGVIVVKHS